MALNERLNLDLSQAQRETARLGSRLDKILENRALKLNVDLSALDSGLSDFRREAAAAAADISKIAGDGVNFDKTVQESARAKTAIKELGEEQKRNEKVTDRLNASWKRLALTAAGLFGAREIKEFFEAAARAASDTVESVNAVSKVYDDAADTVERFVETSDQLGFSAIEARNAAVQFGGLFQAFDFPQEQAAEFSNKLTKISADLSSIYNRDPDDAARALFGVFRGEPEPARVFGLSITQALVDAKALELGLVDTRAEIDQNIKALATFALIEEQAANTTNDFADTLATSLPNQLRVLNAEFANSQARIGEQFQEPLLDAVKLIRAELVPQLEEALQSVDFGGLIQDALPPLVELITVLIEALPAVIEVAGALGGVFTNLVGVGAQLAGVLGETGTGIGAVLLTANKAEKAFGKFGSSAVLAADGLVRITKDGAGAEDRLIGIGEQALAGALAFGPWGAAAGAAIGIAAIGFGEYQERQQEAIERQEAFTAAVIEANPNVFDLDQQLRFLTDTYRNLSGAADDASGSVENTSLGLLALQTTTALLSKETQTVVADYLAAAGDFTDFAEAIETGTDIFDDKDGGFIANVELFGIDVAIEKLQQVADASDDPRIKQAVKTFLDYGEAIGNDVDQLTRLADAIDESADTIDDDRKSTEENAEVKLRLAVINGDVNASILEQALVMKEAENTLTPFSDAIAAATIREAEFQAITQELSDDITALAVDGVASVLGLQASLGDLAAVDVQIGIDFDQLEEDLSNSFADRLESRIGEIEDQLTVRVKIDDEDNVNNIEEVINEAEQVKDKFIARSNAAARLDLLGLDNLSERVAAGELDGIIAQILDGNEADILLLQEANAALQAVGDLQQAAALEQAEIFKVEYANALLTGAADPFKTWIDGVELTPEDFVKFGEEMSGLLSGSLTRPEIALEREAEAFGIASSFIQGLAGGLTQDEVARQAAEESAEGIDAVYRKVWGIQSPSLAAIELGQFFDEGLAEGLELQGYTKEAAEKLAGQVLGIRGTLEKGLEAGLIPDLEDDEGQADNFVDVLQGIRQATSEAAAEFDNLAKVEADRAAAASRLDQFGSFTQLKAAVESGAADDLLKDIIFAPNAAVFGTIEKELQGAADNFGVDPFGLIQATTPSAQGELFGEEWSFAATEAQKTGLEEGGTIISDLLAEQTEDNLLMLNDAYAASPIIAEIDASAALELLEEEPITLKVEFDTEGLGADATVPGFDKGGIAYDTMYAVAERGNPEMIAGAHHKGSDIFGWMKELGLDHKVEPFFAERFHQTGYRATGGANDGFSAVVAELKSVRGELAAVKASSAAAAEHTARLGDISDSTDLTARMALRSNPVSPTLSQDGWKDSYA